MGGVISGVGKGITTASIGKILQEYGFKVTALKIDPYLNVDAGTLRPTEHGEVWVTSDGGEIDQDVGNYERFLNIELSKRNSITTGLAYKTVIDRERAGLYNGTTVQLIPHVTDEIKNRITSVSDDNDFVLVEVGGVVGDLENAPFLHAIKTLETDIGRDNILYVLVTYMLIPSHIPEMKTKPTQTAIRELMEAGIIPDMIICRGKDKIDDVRKKKIETYVNIRKEYIISCPDCDSIYRVPINLESESVGTKILEIFGMQSKKLPDWTLWKQLLDNITMPNRAIDIAIVGKYLSTGNYELTDSYLSVSEALKHASAHLGFKTNIDWIDSTLITEENVKQLANYAGVIVPGGFGSSGVDGKLLAIEYLRENDIPYLGICYGMQLAVVEFARNVCDMMWAHTTEVDDSTPYPVVDMMEQQKMISSLGGTMRLGSYFCLAKKDTKVYNMYQDAGRLINDGLIVERHRHRYEVNPKYVSQLEDAGLVFSGTYFDAKSTNRLMEFLELPNHRFFVATQAHPEFTSNLLHPNPLFYEFLKEASITN